MARGASNLSVGTQAWADKINAAWRQSAAEIVNAGRMLLQAKEVTPHGDFENMIKTQLDFSPQTARKIMAVASDRRITDRAHGRALPDHWTTLYELTKLDDDELEQAFIAGVIGPKMHRADVPRKRRESPQGGAVPAEGSSEIPFLAAADAGTPHDEREGEDSAVTTHPAATSDQGVPDEADQQPRAGAAGAPTARVTLSVKPDAISRLATGLALAMAASRAFEPHAALAAYPKDMLPQLDELAEFTTWLLTFEELNTERAAAE